MRDRVRLEERLRLEEELARIQAELKTASRSFDASVSSLSALLGSKDAARITAAKDSMQMWSDALRALSEKERVIQRRLAYETARTCRAAPAKRCVPPRGRPGQPSG